MVIVSAMGKMTNARTLLPEKIEEAPADEAVATIDLSLNLVPHWALAEAQATLISMTFEELDNALDQLREPTSYDFIYDQSVSLGEILSTTIMIPQSSGIKIRG